MSSEIKIQKSAFWYSSGKMVVKNNSIPKVKEGSVLIKVNACAVCGSDLRIFNDVYNYADHIAADEIFPNRKYYYVFRSIDVHGNLSNPTYIYEIEIVDNNGQIFLKQDVIRYEAPKPDFVKPARRFVYIEPAFRQIIFPEGTVTGPPSVDTPPLSSILGDTGVDKVWGKTFKVRVKSKQTGRKVDLNLTFKNTGIVNASE